MKFDKLRMNELDETEAQRLAAHLNLPHSDIDRMFRMSEDKWEVMKMSENAEYKRDKQDETEGFERVPITVVPVWKGAFRTAAAVAVIAVVGGAGLFMKMSVPKDVSKYSDEQIKLATNDVAVEEVSTELSEKSESADVVSTTESSRADTKDNVVSGKSESGKEKKSNSGESSSKAAANKPNEDTSETLSEQSEPIYIIKSFEITESEAAEGVCPVGEEPEEQESQSGEEEVIQNLPAGVTSEERLRQVTDDMTVREAIGVLGAPMFFSGIGDSLDEHSENDVAYYTMEENNTLLFIRYNKLNDKSIAVQREVNLIYDGNDDNNLWFFVTQPISEMKSDPENRTFDCVVIDFDPGNNTVKVVCPQYSMFDRAVCRLTDEQTEMLVNSGCGKLVKLRITHRGEIEESYPVGISAESIDLWK